MNGAKRRATADIPGVYPPVEQDAATRAEWAKRLNEAMAQNPTPGSEHGITLEKKAQQPLTGPGWRYDPVANRTYGVPVDAQSLREARVPPPAAPGSAPPPAKPPLPAGALTQRKPQPGLRLP